MTALYPVSVHITILFSSLMLLWSMIMLSQNQPSLNTIHQTTVTSFYFLLLTSPSHCEDAITIILWWNWEAFGWGCALLTTFFDKHASWCENNFFSFSPLVNIEYIENWTKRWRYSDNICNYGLSEYHLMIICLWCRLTWFFNTVLGWLFSVILIRSIMIKRLIETGSVYRRTHPHGHYIDRREDRIR